MLAVVSFLDLGFVVVRPPLGPPSPRDSPLFEERPLVLPSGASEISSPSVFILQVRKLRPRKGGDEKPVVPCVGVWWSRATRWPVQVQGATLVSSCGHEVLGPPSDEGGPSGSWQSGAERASPEVTHTSSRSASISSSTTLETEGDCVTGKEVGVGRTWCQNQGRRHV